MERIIDYFVSEKGKTVVVAKVLAETLCKYVDIKAEFCTWLEIRSLDFEKPLTIEGYTARKIQMLQPDLDVAGVYNFMVTLRERPEKAQEYLVKGFKRK